MGWLQVVLLAGAAVLAVLAAFLPRRRDLRRVAALAAAVLVASQLTVDHWFYLYLPWAVGLGFVGLSRVRLGTERGSSGTSLMSTVSGAALASPDEPR